MIDGAGGGETLPRHPASKARHLLLGEKAYGAGPVGRRRNETAMARDVRQHGIRRAKFGTFSSGRRLMARDGNLPRHWHRWRKPRPFHLIRRAKLGTFSSGRRLRAGIKSTQRKNVHGRTLPCTFRVRWGFRRGGPGLTQPEPDAAGAGHSQGRTQPKLDAAEAGRSRSRTQPGLTQAGGHAPNRVPRRVSCAGRGPGSGCAAARGRGPGAGCRRHSPGRGSAAGCAGRRLRPP